MATAVLSPDTNRSYEEGVCAWLTSEAAETFFAFCPYDTGSVNACAWMYGFAAQWRYNYDLA